MSETVDRRRAAELTQLTREDDDQRSIGAWVRQSKTDTYHASVAYDGHKHETRCGATLKAGSPGQINDTVVDPGGLDRGSWICEHCLEAAGVGMGELTAISGGPPCQGFSHIGTREEDDPRNELYLEMARIVHQAKPVFFVMENVPGLATMHDGEAIVEVCETFQAGGYHVTWDVLNAADYGVPQKRKRVIMLGKRVDVMAMPEEGNPQFHIGAKPGRIEHPEFFRERHDLEGPDQATLEAFGNEPETLDDVLESLIQDGVGPDGVGYEEVDDAE